MAVAYLDIQVPANAEVFVQDVQMKQTGTIRRFATPLLSSEYDYYYRISVFYKQDGKVNSIAKNVKVRGGESRKLDFRPLE